MSETSVSQISPDHPDKNETKYALNVLRRMNLTKGARFEAARRHKKAFRCSVLSIIILSTYVFGFSIINLIVNESINKVSHVFDGASLITSFFIVSFSLTQAYKRHELRAALFLKCAQGIAEIRDEMEALFSFGLLNRSEIEDRSRRYNSIINSNEDNHSDIDFYIYQFKTDENPSKKQNADRKGWLRIRRAYWQLRFLFYIWFNPLFALLFPPIIVYILWYASELKNTIP